MDTKTKGAWLIHHTNKLQGVTEQCQYAEISHAGKTGKLLSAISADNEKVLPKAKLEALASTVGIDKFLLPSHLDTLIKQGLADKSASGDVVVHGLTSASVLSHASNVFESCTPTPQQRAVIELAELTSEKPQQSSIVKEYLSDKYRLDSKSTSQVLQESEMIGFVDYETLSSKENIYFNGNLFRKGDPQKAYRVLESLNSMENTRVVELNDELKKFGCISAERARLVLGEQLFNKLTAVGLYDINTVCNDSENANFITLPSAFGKYTNSMVDDALDLAKAFVSSITYGMVKSKYERGQIRFVRALISKLINGGTVGPVEAIGQDYRVLEMKGVVSVRPSNTGRGYLMKLEKKEVGELALNVLMQGTASESSLTKLYSASVNSYVGPEVNRVNIRKNVLATPGATMSVLDVLRTGGFNG